MRYKIIKMKFRTSVHFGQGNLQKSQYILYADTLFSALCTEAVKQEPDGPEKLADAVKSGRILISDGLPYIDHCLYVPKPMVTVKTDSQGDSVVKKAVKTLEYIPVEKMQAYLQGELDVVTEGKHFKKYIGKSSILTKTVIKENEAAPYSVGVFTYGAHSGLYVLIGYAQEEDLLWITDLFEALSYIGIGGKISAGLGKFDVHVSEVPAAFAHALKAAENSESRHEKLMTLSLSLPKEAEMNMAVKDAGFKLLRRSGFVVSDAFPRENIKKKDLYVFCAGSAFTHSFDGDVYDVSQHGTHPVYRYAKPVFMEVSGCSHI